MSQLLQDITYYFPEFQLSLIQTGIMMGISLSLGSILGLVMGIGTFLTGQTSTSRYRISYWGLNFVITLIRSYPFLLFVIALIPITRWIIGSSFGPIPASFPLTLVTTAIFARQVEQVLLDVPKEITYLAESLGVSTWQYVWHFLLVEARSGLVLAFTTTVVSIVSYSTVMGIVGGGGIGDFAIRYGYQSYKYGIMYFTVIIMILAVFAIQMVGSGVARQIDKRK